MAPRRTPQTSYNTQIRTLCERLNITLAAYAPGDGEVRYRFIKPGSPSVDYDGVPSSYILGTCTGARQALTWLAGFEACSAREVGLVQAAERVAVAHSIEHALWDDEVDRLWEELRPYGVERTEER